MKEVKVDFSRSKWDKGRWLKFKSLRWEYTGEFDQEDDHVVNRCPAGVSDEELYEKHVCDVYASMVYGEKISGSSEIVSTMSFDHLMAPLIVLTPELPRDEKGRLVFRSHYEVVLYNEGINVWHYSYENGKLDWHLAAFARAPFEPKKRYQLKVSMARGKREMRMTVECGSVKFGFEDASLPESFYAGITGCEGRNRFYDFSMWETGVKLDPLADGEH